MSNINHFMHFIFSSVVLNFSNVEIIVNLDINFDFIKDDFIVVGGNNYFNHIDSYFHSFD